MTRDSLDNYLRMHRRRTALSQEEMAFLVGLGSGGTIARYESFERQPSLETALAFEAIYRAPVAELFAGRFNTVEQSVAGRAVELIDKVRSAGFSPSATAKLHALMEIAQPRKGSL